MTVTSAPRRRHTNGMLATTTGQRDLAIEHFEHALQLSAEMASPPWQAATQYEYARSLLKHRDANFDRRPRELAFSDVWRLQAIADRSALRRTGVAGL